MIPTEKKGGTQERKADQAELHDHVDHLLGAAADSMRKVCALVLINGGFTLGLLAPPV
jgi:hypothetical protein